MKNENGILYLNNIKNFFLAITNKNFDAFGALMIFNEIKSKNEWYLYLDKLTLVIDKLKTD